MVLPELESGLPACLYGTKHAQAQAGAGRHRIGQGPETKRPIAEMLSGRITRFTWRDRHGKMLMPVFSCQVLPPKWKMLDNVSPHPDELNGIRCWYIFILNQIDEEHWWNYKKETDKFSPTVTRKLMKNTDDFFFDTQPQEFTLMNFYS
jgi:hypothetical protein